MSDLKKLCAQLQELRGEKDKAESRIESLTQMLEAAGEQERDLLRQIGELAGDPNGGKIRHTLVKVGEQAALISTHGGFRANVKFLELQE